MSFSVRGVGQPVVHSEISADSRKLQKRQSSALNLYSSIFDDAVNGE